MPAWKDYQESAAAVFRDLGFSAETDVRVEGVRNHHDVDVLATYEHAGLDIVWVIECKFQKRRVSKDRVLTLRSVVEDIGADRGLILAENGFQSGAVQATHKSSVFVHRLDDLRAEAKDALVSKRLLDLPARIGAAHGRYWALPKWYREEVGLRPESGAIGYSGSSVLSYLPMLVVSALGNDLPPRMGMGPNLLIHTRDQAADVAEYLIHDLEIRLSSAEHALPLRARAEIELGEARRRDQAHETEADETEADDKSLGYGLGLLLGITPAEALARFISNQGLRDP